MLRTPGDYTTPGPQASSKRPKEVLGPVRPAKLFQSRDRATWSDVGMGLWWFMHFTMAHLSTKCWKKYGGVRKRGYPQIILSLDFPWNKPSSYWVFRIPIYGNLHILYEGSINKGVTPIVIAGRFNEKQNDIFRNILCFHTWGYSELRIAGFWTL